MDGTAVAVNVVPLPGASTWLASNAIRATHVATRQWCFSLGVTKCQLLCDSFCRCKTKCFSVPQEKRGENFLPFRTDEHDTFATTVGRLVARGRERPDF